MPKDWRITFKTAHGKCNGNWDDTGFRCQEGLGLMVTVVL